ncbi:MAG: translation initiation factor IF-2 subunit gamma [Nanoarchaeota archaeon]|nr:translation initiation factor IF-2 subunit gamma [bacterium]MBU3958093.1 translation initiation factor IF-2 subunit gamma [Nanoarchaeota archaeon]
MSGKKETESAEEKSERKPEETDPRLIPEFNLITLGHVDHGKTSLTQALSGKWADTHSEEMKRGITLRLGYADITIYRCEKDDYYSSTKRCPKCMEECEPVRTFSIVDAPGHETLMATVLAGTAIADGALLLIAANEGIQAQTREHLMVLNISGIKNIIIVQNKIDLVTEEQALKNYKEIKELIKGTVAESAPIIPVSAQQKLNIDALLKAINRIPKRASAEGVPRFFSVRSFDINKPGTEIEKLNGGILGGSIVSGVFSVGDSIEIKPGVKRNNKWETLKTKITGLQKAGKNLEKAGPGGLVGMLTSLDPSLAKSDSLAGSAVSAAGAGGVEVRSELNLKINFFNAAEKKVSIGEPFVIVCGVARSVGAVSSVGKTVSIKLKLPVCASAGDRVALSRQIQNRWKLAGHGIVV